VKLRKTTKLIGVSILALGGLTGCPDEPEPQTPISHAAVQAQLQDNLKGALSSLDRDLAFVETSELGQAAADFNADDCGEPELGDPEAAQDCEPEPFDLGLTEMADEMVEIIEEVLTEDAIESSTTDTIVYKLSSSVLCKEDIETSEGEDSAPAPVADAPTGDDGAPESEDDEGPAEDVPPFGIDDEEEGEDCEEMVERLEPRIAVSKGAGDALRLQLMVGADRIAPVTLNIGPGVISADVDLAEAKNAAESISVTLGEELPPLPPTFEGAVKLALNTGVINAPTVSLAITEAIHIADPESESPMSIRVAAADPAAAFTIDSAKKQLKALIDMGAVNADFTIVPEADEPETRFPGEEPPEFEEEEEEMEPIRIALALAGLDVDAVFDIESKNVDVKRFGLGDATTTLTINGEDQLSVDLNANDGRATAFTVAALEEAEGALITLTEAVAELRVETQFAAPEARPEDWADWMEHEVITARLDGEGAGLSIGEEGVAVVAGRLTLDAEYGQVHHEVEAGQCIGFPGGEEDHESPEGEEDLPEEAPASHPLAELEVNACG